MRKLPFRFQPPLGIIAVLFIGLSFTNFVQTDLLFNGHFEYILHNETLPTGYNGLFAGSGECVSCHGFDTAMIASVDPLGNDINLVDDWRASMMANSAKDPFWRAKVSHENIINPQLQAETENLCIKCHAPLGAFAAYHSGQSHYSIAEMEQDSIAMDGVSCLACHQQNTENFGNGHTGDLRFDTAKVAYGPYFSPLESPMLMRADYKPVHGPHVKESGVCASCHSLLTSTVDLEGNVTGNTFIEQATYHEWLNSTYNTIEGKKECQTCHMPALSKSQVLLAAGYPDTEPRAPFFKHELVGANAFMQKILRDNIEELGISATVEDFDESIAKTMDMLQNKALDIDVEFTHNTADTAYFEMLIENKAGHKFPSGYPSRRAFVNFLVYNQVGDTIFHSGNWDENMEVYGHDDNYEPHHDIIRSEDDAQIYEMVVSDINGNRTTVLERMATPLKDNRIPPLGFTTTHEVYDTTFIAGAALEDTNFNKIDNEEGSGSDNISFHIPIDNVEQTLFVDAAVYYQTAPPRWMEEMFAESSPEIDSFKAMFNAADKTPILVRKKSIEVSPIVSTYAPEISEWINIQKQGDNRLSILAKTNYEVSIYEINGRLLSCERHTSGIHTLEMNLPQGLYIFHFKNESGHPYNYKYLIQH